MDTREISARLHDILRAAQRVRAPGPGSTAEANIESIHQVKARLRALIEDLGDREAPRLPPRLQANATDFPQGRIAGTRAIVQHRRRVRSAPASSPRVPNGQPQLAAPAASDPIRLPDPRTAAEALFRRPVVDLDRGRSACIAL